MSVRPREFTAFPGTLRPAYQGPWIVARYALANVFRSRLFVVFFIACLIPSVVFLVAVYLRYNVEVVSQFIAGQAGGLADGFAGEWLYQGTLRPSLYVSFLVVMVVGPGLVSPDLKDNALPLYLSRPLSKPYYVLGKLLVLVGLTAAVTWIPGLLLVFLNAYYAADGWLAENLSVPFGLVATCLVWTVCLSMIALALSAWVRWRPAATLGFLGLFVIGEGVGGLMRVARDDWVGSLIVPMDAIDVVGRQLFGTGASDLMPLGAAWATLCGATVLAALAVLHRVRAYEVVR